MREFDLIIIGAGSGNSILTPDFDDWNVAIVEEGPFGGTCLNRGCIPSKMFVYVAELARHARDGERYGIQTSFDGADWKAIRDRVFDRIDPIAEGGRDYRDSLETVTVFPTRGVFVGPKQLAVGDEIITAPTIVLAAGARVAIPPVPGLADVEYDTSDTIMRIDAIPDHLIVIGGGFIAAELGNVFGSLGSEVTYLLRSQAFLRDQDVDISAAFTDIYSERYGVRTGVAFEQVSQIDDQIRLVGSDDDGAFDLVADTVLVAVGRSPNGDELAVSATGVELDDAGYVIVDEFGRTNVDGIWALGDISNPVQLKHVANAETRMVAHNIANPDDLRTVPLGAVPHAVFGDPQIGSVGLRERDVVAAGIPYVAVKRPYRDAAYGWAMEDTTSFAKLIAHAETRELLGAHIIGPQAPTLIQQLIQGMRFGQTVDEMARDQYYIHPALPEVVEQALLEL